MIPREASIRVRINFFFVSENVSKIVTILSQQRERVGGKSETKGTVASIKCA